MSSNVTRTLNVWIELTEQCQFKCRFCYNYWREAPPSNHEHMSSDTVDRLLEFLNSARNDFNIGVAIAGGDPTAHPDYVGITRRIADVAHDTCIVTHGGSLNSAALAELKNARNLSIQFSIPSLDPTVYRHLTGTPRLENALIALAQCALLRIPRTVSVVVTKINLQDIGGLVHLLAEAGGDYIVFNRFLAAGRGQYYEDEYEIEEVQFKLALAAAREAARRRNVRVLASGNTTNIRSLKAAEPKITVGVDGQIRICSLSRETLGSLTDHPLDLVGRATVFWNSDASLADCSCSRTGRANVRTGIR